MLHISHSSSSSPSPSTLASSTASPSISENSIIVKLHTEFIPKAVSDMILKKFSDASEFGFVYEQSGLWSPPVQRNFFLSPKGKILMDREIFLRLRSIRDDEYDLCTGSPKSGGCRACLKARNGR
ncbi:hypothetical protein SAY87_014950 [Trapa incisa]|uniref:Uncharacterized protein n=1 Tax=Trapa incisa TaxID=236973 RepID=A0AAN7H0G6_9MYRT|nr:hypothetical protein SAY87_014950 [Trapa incisa]